MHFLHVKKSTQNFNDVIVKTQESSGLVSKAFESIEQNNAVSVNEINEVAKKISNLNDSSDNITLEITNVSSISEENSASINELIENMNNLYSMIEKIENDAVSLSEQTKKLI